MTPLQIPSATLANGVTMPRLVFGTYQIKDPKICQKAVEDALEAGYRAIDTAQSYGNEAAVGAALKACGLPRSEVFITTKLWVEDASEAGARRAALRSMELLGLDYLDLYLIHQPVGDVFGAWRTIEALYREDLLRAVGVSNFSPDRLMDMALSSTIRPQVNQIEINPFCQQKDALPVMASLGILPEAWAPFAEGRNGLFSNAVLAGIAAKHNASIAQIVLAMILKMGAVVVSKSANPERIRENIRAAEVLLDQTDMTAMAALDTGRSQFFSHRDPEIIKWFHSRHIEH